MVVIVQYLRMAYISHTYDSSQLPSNSVGLSFHTFVPSVYVEEHGNKDLEELPS